MGEHGLYRKGQPYISSMGVPFIIRYPGKIEKSKVVKTAYSSPDFAPTILSLMGIDYSGASFQGIDGSEELLSDEIETNREQIRFSYSKKGKWIAAIDRQYKLILSKSDPPVLFDLEADPDELINYHDEVDYESIVQNLKSALFNATNDFLLSDNTTSYYFDNPVCNDPREPIPSYPSNVCEDLNTKSFQSKCVNDTEVANYCPTACRTCCDDSEGRMWYDRDYITCDTIQEEDCNVRERMLFCPNACNASWCDDSQ